jgi:hypothetical protein
MEIIEHSDARGSAADVHLGAALRQMDSKK